MRIRKKIEVVSGRETIQMQIIPIAVRMIDDNETDGGKIFGTSKVEWLAELTRRKGVWHWVISGRTRTVRNFVGARQIFHRFCLSSAADIQAQKNPAKCRKPLYLPLESTYIYSIPREG